MILGRFDPGSSGSEPASAQQCSRLGRHPHAELAERQGRGEDQSGLRQQEYRIERRAERAGDEADQWPRQPDQDQVGAEQQEGVGLEPLR